MGSNTKTIERKIEIINSKNFLESYKEFQEGKRHIAEISSKDFFIHEYETQPLVGFVAPEGFPNCCAYHKGLYQSAKATLDNFPMCCEAHKKLIDQPWFDKLNYAYVPDKVLNTLAYTDHCIGACINNEEWFKEITDYISVTVDSYGQFPHDFGPPLGLSLYLNNLEANILGMDQIPEEKKQKLFDFLDRYTDIDKGRRPPDLNQLLDIYRQWLRVFPFEVSYLSHLREHFQRKLPILRKDTLETNIYTGISSFKVISKEELINHLTETTREIIEKVNALESFKKGTLGDKTQTEIELLNARQAIKLESLRLKRKDSAKDYLKLLNKWLKYEKEYISQLVSLLANDYSTQAFILNIIEGIKLLQSNDINADCIATARGGGSNKESKFRYWFKDFLFARYKGSVVTAEEENGPGRMDLKIYHKNFGTKVIEFKGWWNYDKGGASGQLINYLTDFESEGYVFMINHLKKKGITENYQRLVENSSNYINGTWVAHKVPYTDFYYYESRHESAIKQKAVYHFLFNVNF